MSKKRRRKRKIKPFAKITIVVIPLLLISILVYSKFIYNDNKDNNDNNNINEVELKEDENNTNIEDKNEEIIIDDTDYIGMLEYKAKTDSLVSANQINEWVSEKTNGKIPSIISSIDNIKMILINAIYYHGVWRNQFRKSNTKQETFIYQMEKVEG